MVDITHRREPQVPPRRNPGHRNGHVTRLKTAARYIRDVRKGERATTVELGSGTGPRQRRVAADHPLIGPRRGEPGDLVHDQMCNGTINKTGADHNNEKDSYGYLSTVRRKNPHLIRQSDL